MSDSNSIGASGGIEAWRVRRAIGTIGIWIVILAVTAIILVPLLWAVGISLKSYSEVIVDVSNPFPRVPKFENYASVFRTIPFFSYFLNTVWVTVACCAGTLLTSSMAAYAFARLKFRGRDALFLVYLATLMVPRQVTLIPNFVLFRMTGLIDTRLSLVLTGIFTAYGTFLLRQFFLSIPRELEEAAIIDGYGYWARFSKIILPLAKPALTTLLIITLLAIWNEYLYALVFINTETKRTLTLGLAIMRGDFDVQWNLVMAATLLAIVPLLTVYVFLQRFFVEGIALSGIKG
jgi:multiple sugar transport system permease protein